MIENHAQCVDIDGWADELRLTAGLLGSHVFGSAHGKPGLRQTGLALHRARQAEVGDLRYEPGEAPAIVGRRCVAILIDFMARLHQDVQGFQVAVNDPLPVRGFDCSSERFDQLRRLMRRPRPAVKPVGERATVDPFHREIRPVAGLADLVDLDNVGVHDASGELRLALKPQTLQLRRKLAGQDHLESDQAVQPAVVRLVDDPHAATSHFGDDVVSRDLQGRRRGRLPGGGRRQHLERGFIRLGARQGLSPLPPPQDAHRRLAIRLFLPP